MPEVKKEERRISPAVAIIPVGLAGLGILNPDSCSGLPLH